MPEDRPPWCVPSARGGRRRRAFRPSRRGRSSRRWPRRVRRRLRRPWNRRFSAGRSADARRICSTTSPRRRRPRRRRSRPACRRCRSRPATTRRSGPRRCVRRAPRGRGSSSSCACVPRRCARHRAPAAGAGPGGCRATARPADSRRVFRPFRRTRSGYGAPRPPSFPRERTTGPVRATPAAAPRDSRCSTSRGRCSSCRSAPRSVPHPRCRSSTRGRTLLRTPRPTFRASGPRASCRGCPSRCGTRFPSPT